MEQLKKLRAKKEAIINDMKALTDAAEENILSAEAQTKFDDLKANLATVQKNIDNLEILLDEQANQDRTASAVAAPVVAGKPATKPNVLTVPAEARKWSTGLKAFKGQDAAENAYKAGMWFCAAFGNDNAKQWCRDHGIALQSVHQGGVNTTGGWLVPEPLSQTIIELVLQYGTFRANAGRIPMTSDTLIIPRRSGGLTAYFVGEGDQITESSKSWDSVKLTVKDMGTIARISNQLASDAIISVMDNLATEIAMCFAKKEDDCGWLGDGTSTYGGISGVEQRLVQVHSSTNINTGTMTYGVYRYDTGNAFSNVALGDIMGTMALLPQYARTNAKFYCNPMFYHGVMVPLLAAAGGVTMGELTNGPTGQKFLGYPVVLCESILGVAAVNRIFMYFGDLAMAAKFGDRQQMAIASSDSATVGGNSVFERNEIALRGTERFDINVHDVGTKATSAGPIVGLMSHTA